MTAHATTTIAELLAAALEDHARALVKRATTAVGRRDDAVRRARVTSRRLRELAGVVTEAGVNRDVRSIEREARRVTRAFGAVRELDVAINELRRASKRHGWPHDRMLAVQRRLEREREQAQRDVPKAMREFDGGHLRSRASRLARAIRSHSDDRTWWRALTGRVTERAERVVAATEACGTMYAPDRLHALRIAIKKLRYALELVTGARGIDVDGTLRALKDMQSRFGRLHDIQILVAEVQTVATDGRSGSARDFTGEIEALERDCRRIHAGVLAHLPDLVRLIAAVRRDLTVRREGRQLPMAKVGAGGHHAAVVSHKPDRAASAGR